MTIKVSNRYAIGQGENSRFIVGGAMPVNEAHPAKFYFNSADAHQDYPTKKVGLDDAEKQPMGEQVTCNEQFDPFKDLKPRRKSRHR